MTQPSPARLARGRRRQRLSDEVTAYVRELILSGQVSPGEFIRPEALAEQLEMSATPAREGLLALQSEGFLSVEPRRGFLVAPLSVKDISDTFDAQALLAGELAARCAAALSADVLRQLGEVQAELEEAAARDELAVVEQLNFDFHRTINVTAAAPKIAWLLRATLSYAPRRFYASIGGWPEATISEHQAVLGALRAGDSQAARLAMQEHVRRAGLLLVVHLERSGTEPA